MADLSLVVTNDITQNLFSTSKLLGIFESQKPVKFPHHPMSSVLYLWFTSKGYVKIELKA
jgi:hypothetical protein